MSTQLVQALWGGILFGSVYGLMALGLTLVWGAVRLLNLAHGALFVVGAYGAYWAVSSLHLPILIALPIGVTAALTTQDAEQIVKWIEATGKNLTTIAIRPRGWWTR